MRRRPRAHLALHHNTEIAMSNVLLIHSSVFGAKSQSLGLARDLLKRYPHRSLVERALAAHTMPHLDGETFAAMGNDAGDLNSRHKKVVVLVARGGVYSKGTPYAAFDFQEPYLRAVLGFLGMTDVTFVHFEGLAMGPEAASANRSKALADVERLTGGAVAEAAD